MGILSWLFPQKTPEQLAQEKREQDSLAALAAGGIPLDAQDRIRREVALGKDFFSSDLSAKEFLLARESNIDVIGQVMGSSFFNVRYRAFYGNGQRWRQTGELVDLSQAQLKSRSLAMSRMRQEAQLMGASGVIGVKIKSNFHDWSSGMTEFTAVGTAVNIPGWQGEPFTSALSAQEFWQLYKSGYVPHDVAMGVCAYYMYTDSNTQNLLYSFWGGNNRNNCEIPLYSKGFQTARAVAMNKLTADVISHKAEGIVGMDIEFDLEEIEYESGNRTYHDMVAHFLAFGTTVSHRPDVAPPKPRNTMMVIDLAARKKARHGMSKLGNMETSHTTDNVQPGHTG
jgi:uncharacterized protein YbjQ (UPF0145 family)